MKNILIFLFLFLSGCQVFAQEAETNALKSNEGIVGTYLLITVDNILTDGSHVHLYGDNPQGMLIFDGKGNYSLQIMSADRPKYAVGDKSKGTDEENRAAVKGCNSHFGTYTVDETDHTITFNIAHASFPNWEGTKQKRPFTFTGAVFKYTVPSPTTGGAVTGEVVWKRVE